MRIKLLVGIILIFLVLTGCGNEEGRLDVQAERTAAADTCLASEDSAMSGEQKYGNVGEERESGNVGGEPGNGNVSENQESSVMARQNPEAAKMCRRIENACQKVHEYQKGIPDLQNLERVGQMVACLGEAGYAAVDQDNQFNMENPALIEEFCRKAESGKDGEAWLIMVLNNGNLLQLHFVTESGQVEVFADTLIWKENKLETAPLYADHFRAQSWICTDEGYLFFEKHYMEGFGGPYDHVAVRIKPIDAACRELNRKYILPMGYSANNLFTSDWNEHDYQELNFYDLFEKLYEAYPLDISGYISETASTGGVVYQVPMEKFESVIKKYFSVSSQILQKNTEFIRDTRMYEYRPRGLYDTGTSAEPPYPEVIGWEAMEDGTIRLTVNAVWPEQNTGAAFKHQVVVRPLEDGGFQYVSNELLRPAGALETPWYTERLTREQWEKYYLGYFRVIK